jgi:hypothetical protein
MDWSNHQPGLGWDIFEVEGRHVLECHAGASRQQQPSAGLAGQGATARDVVIVDVCLEDEADLGVDGTRHTQEASDVALGVDDQGQATVAEHVGGVAEAGVRRVWICMRGPVP